MHVNHDYIPCSPKVYADFLEIIFAQGRYTQKCPHSVEECRWFQQAQHIIMQMEYYSCSRREFVQSMRLR